MPRAAQEGLRPGPLLLTHSELIRSDFKEFVPPMEIPIHPKVYESALAFTPEFVEQVLVSIPESVAEDLVEIERITGERLPVEVRGRKVTIIDKAWDWGDAWGDAMEEVWENCGVNPNTKYLYVGGDPNIVLHEDIGSHISVPHRTHPMSLEKLRRYFVDSRKYRTKVGYETEGVISWGQHNFLLGPVDLQLVLRNFAIQFNNLGLQRLGVV